jgi:tetratricopeptide (TPR) repeat protein
MVPPDTMLATKKSATITATASSLALLALLLAGCQPSGPRSLLEGERLIREGRHAEAAQKLQDATRLLPNNAQAWNHLGLAHHGAGKANLAFPAYQRALSLDRNLAAARYNLGSLHLEQSNLPAAIAEFTTFTVLSNKSAEGWLKLGTAQMRARQFDAAEKSLTIALKLDQHRPESWNNLGIAQLMRKRPRDAYLSFANALRVQTNCASALLNSAILAQQHLNDRPFALQRYREYLALQPTPANAAAVAETAKLLELELNPPPRLVPTNQVAQASAPTNKPPALTNALAQASVPPTNPPRPPASAPSLPTVAEPKSPATGQGEPPVKVEIVQLPEPLPVKPPQDDSAALPTPPAETATPNAPPPAASQVPTEEPPPPTVAAVEPKKSGLLHKLNPLTWFGSDAKPPSPSTTATPIRPTPLTNPPITLAAATAPKPSAPAEPLVREPGVTPMPGRYNVQRYVYLSPPRPAPGNRRAAATLFDSGRTAQQQGRLGEAIAAYQSATRQDPAFFEAHYNLGLAAHESGDLKRALSAYEHALSINATALNARYNFALTLQQAGYPRDAANELEKLLAGHPQETRAHFTLANLYAQQLYLTQQARPHYLKVLELDPRHPQAAAIRYWLTANP